MGERLEARPQLVTCRDRCSEHDPGARPEGQRRRRLGLAAYLEPADVLHGDAV